ncbi:hypothetical protein SB768_30950 [Burkholderia sp. SIMBA_043]|uniref:hypothetical protein n=1 Tax=Burkholderia TaxID=32008 RepID=UPI0007593121|nr:hypothetical protein [Burkholderia vietnamiensis]KVF72727.1 hypothetical protein WJ17_01145 [Burkholderia vietnamiensis]KVF80063.1 hypothetical protein WJ18_13905 [Burkholderia vietnamiensis]KVF84888.1 hypothetical protein WJ19_18340 [Burkholderia vietnamiensis]KVF86665.1 hypothetical protein WJ20_23585 [Burkholderia vietnamiensis]KVG03602.1 hypothetical protein WJ22_00770 [Burkholderia vietnamiensis]
MSNPLIAGGVKLEKEAAAGVKRAKNDLMSDPLIADEVELGKMAGWVAGDIASSSGDIANGAGVGVGMGSIADTPTGMDRRLIL